MSLFKRVTLAAFVLLMGSLAACVSQQTYNSLDQAYSQLQQAYQGDEVEIRQLQGELKITIKDKILFPEGGFKLNAKADQVLAKMAPTLSGFQNTKVVVRGYTDNVSIGPELRKGSLLT
jgi:chemotaxis protein MotB